MRPYMSGVLLFRVAIALSTHSFFQPDEYFQSLEPAHRLVFGYGSLTWEWLTPKPIRSILYPLLNVPVYALLRVTGLAEKGAFGDWLLIACPRILHGGLASLTDIWLCHLTRRVLGGRYVSSALFLSLTCFFHALALSRSLSNSLETSLSTIAFAHYPWDAAVHSSPNVCFKRSDIRVMFIFIALGCMIRPTNAIIWVYLIIKLLWILWPYKRLVKVVMRDALLTGTCALFILIFLDSLYYGKLTCTPLNFILTNMSSVSLFYGSSSWYYYISQGLPIQATTAIPFILHGMWTATQSKKSTPLQAMTEVICWTVGIYSLSGHKEWRFIHPLSPLLHVLSAKSLDDLTSTSRGKLSRKVRLSRILGWFNVTLPTRYVVWLMLTSPLSLYVVLFYCSAPISAMSFLRSLPRQSLHNITIGVLMPCHSIPGQSYLHREELAHGRMWALGCEPPLHGQDLTYYRDQTDVFYDSPISYLQTYFPPRVDTSFPLSPYPATAPGAQVKPASDGRYPWRHEWPTYLIFFGSLLEQESVEIFFIEKGYTEIWRGGRHWEGDGKRKGGVRIWKWSGNLGDAQTILTRYP
ncbi:hypothetical protein AX15_003170 [Amanita polypyramis BW_CC]|nr:hypothetical protein AX15_003170 [Amanita polypyramis BW_CC]